MSFAFVVYNDYYDVSIVITVGPNVGLNAVRVCDGAAYLSVQRT